MLKPTLFIRIIVCFSCLFLFNIGCDTKSGSPEKTGTVISKKISVADEKTRQPVQKANAASQGQPVKKEVQTKDPTKAAAVTPNAQPEAPKYMPELAMGYDPKGKIDPFAPLIRDEPVKTVKEDEDEAVAKGKGQKREKRIPQTPLERIEINQLRLRAIILAPSGNRALVEESTGKGYILTKGTYIGRNQGVVTNILKDKVIVEETVESIQGDVTTQEKELKLPKPPGEE
jgi:type IV pilus assembly protein PilP